MISWGGGVNSTAIIALHLLGKLKGKPEIVFADTGCEYPKTYEYINVVGNTLAKDGWKITVLRPYTHPEYYAPEIQGKYTNVYDYLWDKKYIPTHRYKACNSRFKNTPLTKYAKGRKYMIGICGDELNRIKQNNNIIYPLKDYTRDGCAWLIGKAGLPIPHKTGCYFCYANKKKEWIYLKNNYPDLWKKSIALENNSKATFGTLPLQDKMNNWKDLLEKGE